MSSSNARIVLGLCIFGFGILKLASRSGRYPGKLPKSFLAFEAAHIMEMVFSTMCIIEEEDFASHYFGEYTSLPFV